MIVMCELYNQAHLEGNIAFNEPNGPSVLKTAILP